ncbi:hypothetical protein ACVIGB_010289 [Bradyrhizobium sp. USDA 4341]
MGYLQLDAGSLGDFSQAIVSIWFRIPAASITAARSVWAEQSDTPSDLSLAGVIPLITFGPNGSQTFWRWVTSGLPGDDGHPEATFTTNTSPCVIGVVCNADEDINTLGIRLQYDSGGPSTPDSFDALPLSGPDFFEVGARFQGGVVFGSGGSRTVTPILADTWYHALISWDVSSGSSVSFGDDGSISFGSVSKFWLAINDVNLTGDALWPNNPACYVPHGGSNDPNGIVSNYSMAKDVGSFAAGNIPTFANTLGIPSDSANSYRVSHVELAEPQFFTGVTLDTSVESNRRKFVAPDPDGKPRPVDPSFAQAFLMKRPEIFFKTREDWRDGNNRGTVGGFTVVGSQGDFRPTPSE